MARVARATRVIGMGRRRLAVTWGRRGGAALALAAGLLLLGGGLAAGCGDEAATGGSTQGIDGSAADGGGMDLPVANLDVPGDLPVGAETTHTPDGGGGLDGDGGGATDGGGGVDSGPPCEGCLLAPCSQNEDCDSGWCTEGPNGQNVCTKQCTESCPAGFSCKPMSGGGADTVYLCVYDHIPYCRPCDTDADCANPLYTGADNHCVSRGPGLGSFCVTACPAGTCPEAGSRCAEETFDSGPLKVCEPAEPTAECACKPRFVEDGASTTCSVGDAGAMCTGERVCEAQGLTACSAATPAPETCNDVDDDCDGETDEGCDDDGDGYCDATMALSGAPDVCPQGGGDCDDDAPSVHPGATERCDDLDNNCAGGADEGCDDDGDGYCDVGMEVVGMPASCPNGLGDCDDTRADVHVGAVELCSDVDEDCDGQTDEGCDDDGDGYCDADMELVGVPDVCPKGAGDCQDDESAVNPGQPEVCNGLDDDCSGEADDGLDAPLNPNQKGACAGTHQVCDADGNWVEDYSAVPGLNEPDEPDDEGLDSNCDGVDGDAATAVFVDGANGDDTNAGTMTSPLRHIQAGIDAQSPGGQVLVANHTYTENLHLKAGVNVYGGYDSANGWVRTNDRPSVLGGTVAVEAVNIDTATVLDSFSIVSATATTPGESSYGVRVRASSEALVLQNLDITAGAGAAGVDAPDRPDAANGLPGDPGRSSTDSDCFCDEFDTYGGQGGKGGTSLCAGGKGAGGKGADSGCGNDSGSSGSPSPDGTFGGGPGLKGSDGADGANGTDGAGGGATGTVTADGRWVGQDGQDGTDGQPGKGGGGGGSGYGDDGGWGGCSIWGGGGGGGGSAGCGGQAGQGGTAGGGSFALFLVDANPTLQGVKLTYHAGGKGGHGGTAGKGGTGASGGDKGTGYKGAGDGGAGGAGGDGGDGGDGGGGAGGPAYGIFAWGSSAPVCTGVNIVGLGTGGAGGTSAGHPGAAGPSGDTNKPLGTCGG